MPAAQFLDAVSDATHEVFGVVVPIEGLCGGLGEMPREQHQGCAVGKETAHAEGRSIFVQVVGPLGLEGEFQPAQGRVAFWLGVLEPDPVPLEGTAESEQAGGVGEPAEHGRAEQDQVDELLLREVRHPAGLPERVKKRVGGPVCELAMRERLLVVQRRRPRRRSWRRLDRYGGAVFGVYRVASFREVLARGIPAPHPGQRLVERRDSFLVPRPRAGGVAERSELLLFLRKVFLHPFAAQPVVASAELLAVRLVFQMPRDVFKFGVDFPAKGNLAGVVRREREWLDLEIVRDRLDLVGQEAEVREGQRRVARERLPAPFAVAHECLDEVVANAAVDERRAQEVARPVRFEVQELLRQLRNILRFQGARIRVIVRQVEEERHLPVEGGLDIIPLPGIDEMHHQPGQVVEVVPQLADREGREPHIAGRWLSADILVPDHVHVRAVAKVLKRLEGLVYGSSTGAEGEQQVGEDSEVVVGARQAHALVQFPYNTPPVAGDPPCGPRPGWGFAWSRSCSRFSLA